MSKLKRFTGSKANNSSPANTSSVWTCLPIDRNLAFDQDFKIHHVIGKGHFGNVYECELVSSDGSLAVRTKPKTYGFHLNNVDSNLFAAKVIKKKRAKRSPLGCDLDDIKREYAILMLCDHENICRLHWAYEDEQNVTFVLDLASAGELFHCLAMRDRLTEQDLARIFLSQILDALIYLHARSIVHLDLKPENLLVRHSGSECVMLIDFGLSRVVVNSGDCQEDSSAAKCIQGTPEFCAPEVLAYDQLSTRTDMWSFGVVCFMILCHQSPFLGESQHDTFVRIQKAQYHIDENNVRCSNEARNFLHALLKKSSQQRLSAVEAKQYSWGSTEDPRSFVDLKQFRSFYVERKRAQLEEVHPEIAKLLSLTDPAIAF